MTKPSPVRSNHIPALDGLRGFAAVIVLVSHVSNNVGLWGGVLGHGGGQIGVMIFFVLSGYLMGFLYLDQPFNSAEVWSYAVHRGARVLPLFYAVVILALLFREIGRLTGLPMEFYNSMGHGIYLLALVDGSDVFWTIPVEIHFYAVFVGLWASYSRFGRASIAVMTCLGVVLLLINYSPLNETLITGAPFFFCGVLISRWTTIRDRQRRFLFSAAAMASFPLALLMFPLITVAVLRRVGCSMMPLSDEQLWHNPLCLAAACGCLIAALCSPIVSSILSSRPMRYLGRISYGLYVLHVPVVLVLYRATHLSQRPVLFLLATLLLSIMLATAVHQFFEAPARRNINRLLAPRHFSLLGHRRRGELTEV